MASLKSLTLFLALCLILSSCLEMRKHSQQEDFEEHEEQTIPKDPKIQQTEAIGDPAGGQFDEWEKSLSQVKSITIYSGTWIDGIRIEYQNRKISRRYGGRGGEQTTWTVPRGEHIAKINLTSEGVIYSIQFITNKGNKSPIWGQDGLEAYSITIPEGYKMVGIFGDEGLDLSRIGFNIAPLQETENDDQI